MYITYVTCKNNNFRRDHEFGSWVTKKIEGVNGGISKMSIQG